jgi:hypothetical protein
VTREELEKGMDELAREYHETHDPEIGEEICRLASELLEKPIQFNTTLG